MPSRIFKTEPLENDDTHSCICAYSPRVRAPLQHAGQPVIHGGNACKNFIGLVPRGSDRIFPRRRPSDHVEPSVALDRPAGDPVLAYDLAGGLDHLVAHCHSSGGGRGLGVVLLVAEVSA